MSYKKLILASQSPRRRDILASLNIDFSVQTPDVFQEFQPENLSPESLVSLNAEGKARGIANKEKNAIILGIDTVCFCENRILEKPKNEQDATQMLTLLQNNSHFVYSGICIIDADSMRKTIIIEKTQVEFYPMTNEEILFYIKTGEPMDKAGAYAIQGIGSMFVKRIDGDFFNVVGLPVSALKNALKTFDIDMLNWVK